MNPMIDRLKEPSTMAGGAALAAGVNDMLQALPPGAVDVAGAVVSAVLVPTPAGIAMAAFGLLSMFMKERSN